jgi:hypothetical protein
VDNNNVSFAIKTVHLVRSIIAISKSKKEYETTKAAIQILIVMIESLKGRIDSILGEIVIFLLNELNTTKSKVYKISLIELVIYYLIRLLYALSIIQY